MAKGKATPCSESSSSDEEAGAMSAISSKKFSPKKQTFKSAYSDSKSHIYKKQHAEQTENSSDSELHYKNLNSIKRISDSTSKISKKVKKRKREEVSDSHSSDGENETDKLIKSVNIKKEVMNVASANNSPIKNDSSPKGNKDEKRNVTSNEISQIILQNIKKEMTMDDSDASNSDHNENSGVVNKLPNGVVKNEVNISRSSSDSDNESEASGSLKSHNSHSTIGNNSTVTILQDIRFTPKKRNPKEILKELYPGLSSLETAELDLSDSDELYVFSMPKNVDPKLLKNVEIDLENKWKIKIGEKYVVAPTNKIPDPKFVISSNSRVLQFKNNIKMDRYMKSKNEPNVLVPETKTVPLPENLKCRHPFFGPDFQRKIQLNEQVEKKIDEAIANFFKRERKSKKKKKKNTVEEEEPNQQIFDLLNSKRFLTNHDRIKKETSYDSAFGSSSSTDKPKEAKKNQNIEEEKDLTNEETTGASHKKKKKKNKVLQDHDVPNDISIKKELNDSEDVKIEGLSKKDRKKLLLNSTLMSDLQGSPKFNSELSTISSEPSTLGSTQNSKKNGKSKEETIKKKRLISNLLNDISMEINTSKKIKTEI